MFSCFQNDKSILLAILLVIQLVINKVAVFTQAAMD